MQKIKTNSKLHYYFFSTFNFIRRNGAGEGIRTLEGLRHSGLSATPLTTRTPPQGVINQ